MLRSLRITELNNYYLSKAFVLPALLICIIVLTTEPSYGELCRHWKAGEKTGKLDPSQIDEASGIAVSTMYPGRLYHVNDSGGGPYFFITDFNGDNIKRVKIEGLKYNRHSDYEDLGLGPCGSAKTCLFIADIGDNSEKRKYVELILIEEKEDFAAKVSPLSIIKLKYPDRPHNAEGIAVHPNGDIYVLTKEENLDKLEAYASNLYKLDIRSLEYDVREPLTLQYVGEIDLPAILPESTVFGQIATSFDISPDGSRFLVLTYENAVEFNFDLSKTSLIELRDMKKETDFNIIELDPLPQQESVAYLQDGSGFIYNTELKGFSVPLITVMCEK